MAESIPLRRLFLLESVSGCAMVLFGIANLFSARSGLHSVVAVYLSVGGIFLSALAVRRRRGEKTGDLPENATGLIKIVEKLSEPKPFGFTCLVVSPLLLGYGGFGLIVFLLLYLSGVNAMRLTDEELHAWIVGSPSNIVASTPRIVSRKSD